MAILAFPTVSTAMSDSEYDQHQHRAEKYMSIYEQAAAKYDVPLTLLIRMGAIESGYWKPSIVSGKRRSSHGAIGIAQFMPKTAKALGVNPANPTSAIHGQARYLRMLYNQFNSWKYAVMAYNWGDSNLRKALKTKRKIPKQVKKYANFITQEIN